MILESQNSKIISHITTGVMLLSWEMAVDETLPCDGNRFLVGISNLKKIGSFHVFFSFQMINLLFSRDLKVFFCRNSLWFLENELIKNPTKKQFQIPTKNRFHMRTLLKGHSSSRFFFTSKTYIGGPH